MAFRLALVSAPAPVLGWLARNREIAGPWRQCTATSVSWGRSGSGWECGNCGHDCRRWGLEGGFLFYLFLGRRAPGSPHRSVWRGPWSSGAGTHLASHRASQGLLLLATPPLRGFLVWETGSPLPLWVSPLAFLFIPFGESRPTCGAHVYRDWPWRGTISA